jgi:hypothetical protein
MDTQKFIEILEKTDKIYEPDDFTYDLLRYQILDNSIETYYVNLINETLKKSLSNLEVDLKHGCRNYIYSFFILPVYWQEIVIIIYLALQLYKRVDNNSRIISLGESPLKLVFIQQIINTQPEFIDILKRYGLYKNIQFTYYPISQLSIILMTHGYIEQYFNSSDQDLSLDNLIISSDMKKLIDEIIDIKDNIYYHFRLFDIDPLSILKSKKKIYFQDRAESYKSIIVIIIFYHVMCDVQHITDEQRLELYELLYIIGFDYKHAENIENDRVKILKINQFFYRLITKKTNTITEDSFHFKQTNYRYKPLKYDCSADGFRLFQNQKNLMTKVFSFLTTPEKTLNKSRCIITCSLEDSYCVKFLLQDSVDNEGKVLSLKQNGQLDGKNCNMINLFLMNSIYKLGPSYIENIIKNLDNIDETRLFDNVINFDTLNQEIYDIMNKTKSASVLTSWFVNKVNQNKIIKKINEFILSNGIFADCAYNIPLIKLN